MKDFSLTAASVFFIAVLICCLTVSLCVDKTLDVWKEIEAKRAKPVPAPVMMRLSVITNETHAAITNLSIRSYSTNR